MAKFLEWTNGGYIAVNSYFLHRLLQLRTTGYYKVHAEVMRADTVSYVAYKGIEEFWWLILYYNGITRFENLRSGMILKLFDLADLEKLTFEISSKQQLLNQEEAE